MMKLLATIIPSNEMSLTDLIALLGYSDTSGEISSSSFRSKHMFNELSPDCLSKETSTHISSVLPGLPELNEIHSQSEDQGGCDLNQYMLRWISYMQYLSHGSSNGSSVCNAGKYLIHMSFQILVHNIEFIIINIPNQSIYDLERITIIIIISLYNFTK